MLKNGPKEFFVRTKGDKVKELIENDPNFSQRKLGV